MKSKAKKSVAAPKINPAYCDRLINAVVRAAALMKPFNKALNKAERINRDAYLAWAKAEQWGEQPNRKALPALRAKQRETQKALRELERVNNAVYRAMERQFSL